MSIKIGIDIGISTCKIAGFNNNKPLIPVQSETSGVSVLAETLELFFSENNISPSNISAIATTGVGSTYIKGDICGITPSFVSEFDANAAFAIHKAKSCNFTVISMGTGTSYIHVKDNIRTHLGGLALGGGTIKGLCSSIIKPMSFKEIMELSLKGSEGATDLRMKDITNEMLPGLIPEISASDFAKATGNESASDMAAGVVHLVIENILQTGVLVSKPLNVHEFVLIGGLAHYPQCSYISNLLVKMHGNIEFNIPSDAVFGSASGAALSI